MVKWNEAVKALLKIVPATPAQIDACRRTLDKSEAPHAARGDYWPWYQVYTRLLKGLLMTFDVRITDHGKYYGFANEIVPFLKSRVKPTTKEQSIIDVAELWTSEGAQGPVLQSVARWAIACYVLDDPSIEPDPKPKESAAA